MQMSLDDEVADIAAAVEAVEKVEAPIEPAVGGEASEHDAMSLQRGQLSDAQAGAEEPGQAFKPDVAALEASDEAVQLVPAKVVAPAKAVRAKRAAKAAPAKMPRCRREGAVEVGKHCTSQMFIIRL